MEIPATLIPVIIILISITIARLLDIFLNQLIKKADKSKTKIDDIILHAIGKPLHALVIVAGLYYAIHYTPYVGEIINEFDEGFKYRQFILTIFGTWVVATLVKKVIIVYGYDLAARTESDLDDRLIAIADMSAMYVIWLVGIMMALSGIGIAITPLITGMGIAGLAIALAAQNLLSNVLGGMTVTMDSLYKVGDRVEMGGIYGDVYEIKPRYTKIKTLNDTVITIPNYKVINEQIINYAVPSNSVRVKIPVSVAYGTDPEKVNEILLSIAEKINLVLKTPQPIVRFTEYASSSQNFELLVWIRHYDDRHPVIDSIFREIFIRFKNEGIEIPFNQMDIHIKQE